MERVPIISKVLESEERGKTMEKLAASLLEELNVETVFTIPILGGIPVSESVVVTWIIMAVMIFGAYLLGRDCKGRAPGTRQQIAELIVTKLDKQSGRRGQAIRHLSGCGIDFYRYSQPLRCFRL